MKNERKTTFLLITVPILALFVCFNTIPLIRGVIYSFTNFKGFGSYDWVGFRNYIDLFTDARVGKSYLFTFKLAVVTTIVVNVISLILALALNSKIRAKSFFRGAYFLPNILGALVVGYIFNYFFTYILPAMGAMIGSDSLSKSILSNPSSAWLGTSPNPLISSTTEGLEVNRRKCIVAEESDGSTSKAAVYAGGDAVTGAATVILAMGAGKAAAKGIDEFLSK